MSISRHRVFALSIVLAATATGGSAQAQGTSLVSKQRVLAARAHFEAVCLPLEERGNYRAAARCFTNVSEYLNRSTAMLVNPVSPRPVAAVDSYFGSPLTSYNPYRRRSANLLGQNYVLLGVGF